MTPAPNSHVTETAQAQGTPAKGKVWQMTATEWLICALACVGFAFDTYTLLVLTLIVRPALTEMRMTRLTLSWLRLSWQVVPEAIIAAS